jgi:hypothetical protein
MDTPNADILSCLAKDAIIHGMNVRKEKNNPHEI